MAKAKKKKSSRQQEMEEALAKLELDADTIAYAIDVIAQGMQRLDNSRLSRRAVVLLIQDAAPGHISRTVINTVLDYAQDLGKFYLQKKNK